MKRLHTGLAAMAMLSMGGFGGLTPLEPLCGGLSPYDRWHPSSQPQAKKCLLPDCKEMTEHNGGYCSAKHCKLHKQKMKSGLTFSGKLA